MQNPQSVETENNFKIPPAEYFSSGAVLLFDKPYRWTSFDVVNKVKYAIKKRYKDDKIKVGHAGTLDPLATGLLIICTGKKTKEIDLIQAQTKEYTGTFTVGATTVSYDLEREPEDFKDYAFVTPELINDVVATFIGEIDQTPPIFSAVKIDGKRAFSYARAGEEVVIKSKKIRIYEFEITGLNLPEVNFRISCSKGTYIRSIANDFGVKLGCGAYMSALRRTKIGEFEVIDAIDPEAFANSIKLSD